MSEAGSSSSSADPPRRGMRYENLYVWLIFVAALDIMLTWIVLYRGGREANGLANYILSRFGLSGMVIFKFAIVLFVILICEAIGRRNAGAGLKFARWAIGISCIPLVVATVLLLTRL